MRIIYLDETGHSARESVAAVAGIMLDPDRQWRIVAEAINALKAEVPAEIRRNYIFHATDLFQGGKHRSIWPKEERWSLLERLVAIPRILQIPLVLGFDRKPTNSVVRQERGVTTHVMAYAYCLHACEYLMERRAAPHEFAMIVAEDRPEARQSLRVMQALLSREDLFRMFMPADFRWEPIARIKAPPAFAAKDEEELLQISDACAFVLQRYLNRSPGWERFVKAMFGGEHLSDEAAFVFEQPAGFFSLWQVPDISEEITDPRFGPIGGAIPLGIGGSLGFSFRRRLPR